MFVVVSVIIRFWCFNWFVFGSRIGNKPNIFRIFVPEIKVETDMETLPDKRQKSPVKIRFKQLADGCKSIYLDTYLNGKRKYEFLKLYIHPEADSEAQLANAEAMRMAEEMRSERLSQLGIEEAASQADTQEREDTTEEQTAKARVRAKRTSREPVTIRAKDLKDGRQSLYLDIYFRGERKYEFLKLYTVPGEDAANAEAEAHARICNQCVRPYFSRNTLPKARKITYPRASTIAQSLTSK